MGAVESMYGLCLEDGSMWGEVAIDHQVADIEAVFSATGPNKHFITRPRGGSKTTDMAGMAASWLASDAPPRSRGVVVANNAEQSGILIDAAASLIVNTPELDGALTMENERIINSETGAWVRILTMSDSGAWGLRGVHLIILDEFAQWPETRGATRVYTAVRTTVQKVKGCKLVILTSAGEPSHWSYTEVFKKAEADPKGWRISQMPGPVPWQDPVELAALKRELLPSQYERLILNIWTEDEDRAISPDDYEACAHEAVIDNHGRKVTLRLARFLHPNPDIRYHIFVDIGTVSDATVIVVAHKEPVNPDDEKCRRYGPFRLIIDRLDRWQGTKKRPVQLSEVEDHVAELSAEWNRARVVADPTQFVGNLQNLNRRGIKAEEFTFGATTVGQVATALVQTFRNHLAVVPDAPILREELLRIKLRESSPGVARLDHDHARHDDQGVTIGMAAYHLIGNTGWGGAAAFKTFMKDQIAKRGAETPSERAARRERERFERRLRGPRRRHQVTCDHRWREGHCVFCPAVLEAESV